MQSTITLVALVVVALAYLGVAGALPWLFVKGRALQAETAAVRRSLRLTDGTPLYAAAAGGERYLPGRAT